MLNTMLVFCTMAILLAGNITCSSVESGFTFIENSEGVALEENGSKVFFYQTAPLPAGDNRAINPSNSFNNYLHPLYNLDGEVITEANPKGDRWHAQHRGIFWGWHQLLVNGEEVGDSWTMDHVLFDISEVTTTVDFAKAELSMKVDWIAEGSKNKQAFVEERTRIVTYALKDDVRIIDFEISLRGLIPNVEIGGSKDSFKGYGGFSARILLADSMKFFSEKGPVKPIGGQLHAGPWVDFSTPDLSSPHRYGISILCHPSLPGFPHPWLLRRKNSMQNPAFPGFDRASISMEKPTVLRYRIIVHKGDAEKDDISKLYNRYAKK